jgi:hypothetical protein
MKVRKKHNDPIKIKISLKLNCIFPRTMSKVSTGLDFYSHKEKARELELWCAEAPMVPCKTQK